MSQENVDKTREFIAAYNRRDFDAAIKDFDPENLQKRQEVKDADGNSHFLRNDLADLKQNIDLLYRLKDRWKLPAVRRAWGNAAQREEIVNALGKLRSELERVAEGEK